MRSPKKGGEEGEQKKEKGMGKKTNIKSCNYFQGLHKKEKIKKNPRIICIGGGGGVRTLLVAALWTLMGSGLPVWC